MTTTIGADDLTNSDGSSQTSQTDTAASIRPTEHSGVEQLAIAALVVVVMTVIATSGFGTIFSSSSYLLVALAGATLGALVVVVGRQMNLLFGEIVGVGLIAPMIVGPLAVGGTDFYRGLVFGWADILSATPPVDPTAALKALPFIAAFVGALAGTELFRIRELPGLGVVGPLGTLALTALFSEQTRTGAITVGLVLLVGLLVLARLHYASLSSTGLLVLGLVLALVAAAASMASVALPYADEERRFDLRDLQVPPWNPLDVPSPLVDVKAGLLELEQDEEPVLRVRGDVPVDRWRMASLPAYSGVHWSVAEADQASDFVAIDTFLPDIADERQDGDSLTFDVDILASLGTWVPTAGVPERVVFGDETDARMSLETGTIGVPGQLQAGNSYALSVTPWLDLDDAALAAHVFVADSTTSDLELLSPVVRNFAADISTGLDQLSGTRVIAIRDSLRFGSYDQTSPPGHNIGRIGEFLQLVNQGAGDEGALRAMVGFEEIYTATAGLLTRLSDIPVRVAVGYVIPDERWVDRSAEVFASDINAWLEVHIEGQGWMPIDVTPDRENQPEDVEENLDTTGAPIADPPASPPLPEEDTPPEVEEPEDEEEENVKQPQNEWEKIPVGITPARVAIGGASAGIGSLLALGAAVVGYKVWRRRRRRTADQAGARIAGAWAELVDRVDEAGGGLPSRATPAEAAMYARAMPVLGEADVVARVERLANHVSVAAFHPRPPSEEAADDAWQAYEEVVQAMKAAAGPGDRLRRAVDPRPLREDDRVGVR